MSIQASNQLVAAGVEAMNAGRAAEAAGLFERALLSHPDNARALGLLGALLADAKEFERAEALFERAIELAPKAPDAYVGLSSALHRQKRYEDAIRCCERGLRAVPRHASLRFNQAVNLHDAGRHDEALAIAEKLVKEAPNVPRFRYFAATVFDKLGKTENMIRSYALAAEFGGGDPFYEVATADALMRAGRAAEALPRLEAALRRRPWEVKGLALKTLALAELGRQEEERALADPQRLAQTLHLRDTGPDDTALAALNRQLSAFATHHPSMREDPPENATYRAWHSGNLSREQHPALDRLKSFIRRAYEARRASLASEDPNHPFVRALPAEVSLNLWSVRMVGGSKMTPHIHTSGWLSGVYYVDVPAVSADPVGKAGWLKLGPARNDIPMHVEPLMLAVQPVPGRMVTFPSYVWHDTIPLPDENTEQRLCYAWDLEPRGDGPPLPAG